MGATGSGVMIYYYNFLILLLVARSLFCQNLLEVSFLIPGELYTSVFPLFSLNKKLQVTFIYYL